MQAREKDNRRDWLIILFIILIGLLCILLAGGWAVRLTPSWSLDSNMESKIDPNSQYLTERPNGFIVPVNSSILTQPGWYGLFLTPGASFKTGTPPSTTVNTQPPPPPTQTKAPTIIPTQTNTPWVIIYPTNTSIVRPPSTRTPISSASADLRITVTDGSATYIAGGTITYTIVVSNPGGPATVNGAAVVDNFPATLSGITWTCASIGGAICTPNGTGNINNSINLPVGSSVTYTVNANISPAATGNLVNTATVILPASITDPIPGNNTATDTDTPATVSADLQITKTDGVTTYIPGNSVTYSIVVTNAGPATVTGATVTDTFPAQLTVGNWSCVATGGASCTANGIGNINDTVNIPVGGTLTYTATANIAISATGNLANTALVTVPAGYSDPNMGNNSATDMDTYTSSADLQITKNDGSATYTPNAATVYTIVVSNNGPDAVTGATIIDNKSTLITNWSWACSAQNGGATGCDPISNSTANFTDTVDLPNGGSITYTVTANISAYAIGTLANTASVNVPAGITDTNSGNNSATDSDTSSAGTEPNVGGPDGNDYNPGPTGSITLLLSQGITAGGTNSPDFVYYEIRSNPVMVDMDWVQIEISADGITWYTVFVWGDGFPDTNSNVDINVIGGTENDNRQINTSNLYNQTGVTINIDAIPGITTGTIYPWMRISGIGGADGPNIDAIQPYYP